VNQQINGCKLLLLTSSDLTALNISKVGHQEIILEAVEVLKQLHYNFTSETLQTITLKLACRARSLYNSLRYSAANQAAKDAQAAAAAAAAEAAAAAKQSLKDSKHKRKKEKGKKSKDKDHEQDQNKVGFWLVLEFG